MSQENNQFEIPGIQLRESKTQPRVSLSREIGEARITHNIFGKAKVRIIRKQDKLHQALWLAAGIVVVAITAAIWQGWLTSQPAEMQQGTDLTFSANSEVQAAVPASQPENIGQTGTLPTVKSEPVASPITAIATPAVIQKSPSQQPAGVKAFGQTSEKADAVQPKPVMIKPKPEPLAAGNPQLAQTNANLDALKNQTDKPLSAKILPAKRQISPAATSAVAQPAASSAAAATPAASPVKQEPAIQPPLGDSQLSAPISLPGR